MGAFKSRRVWLLAVLCVLVLLVGCGKKETRWDSAQEQSANNQPATSDESVAGGSFNKFFPAEEEGFEVIFTQEKTGFAQAKLKNDGTDVAQLSITDTVNNPEAAEKYAESSETLAGFPLAAIGSKGTGILVADRYQVQVRSLDDSFTEFDRDDWLQKFDLDGLSQLQ
jgi:hypothetical protein